MIVINLFNVNDNNVLMRINVLKPQEIIAYKRTNLIEANISEANN